MTVTALPTAAEAPDDRVPRRLFMQSWFTAMTARDLYNPHSGADHDSRTWLELVAAYAFADAVTAFEEEMRSAIAAALETGQLPYGGFLQDGCLHQVRDKAIRAAFAAGCAEILAGEVGQS